MNINPFYVIDLLYLCIFKNFRKNSYLYKNYLLYIIYYTWIILYTVLECEFKSFAIVYHVQ